MYIYIYGAVATRNRWLLGSLRARARRNAPGSEASASIATWWALAGMSQRTASSMPRAARGEGLCAILTSLKR